MEIARGRVALDSAGPPGTGVVSATCSRCQQQEGNEGSHSRTRASAGSTAAEAQAIDLFQSTTGASKRRQRRTCHCCLTVWESAWRWIIRHAPASRRKIIVTR